MNIDTTINITDNNTVLLKNSAEKLNVSTNVLIIRLITKFLVNTDRNIKAFQRISYQKKDETECWVQKHLWFSPEFYEKCLDLRKFYKLSLSNVLAVAINLYLVEKLKGVTDNYTQNYTFMQSKQAGCGVFTITWGYPGNEMVKELLQIYERT